MKTVQDYLDLGLVFVDSDKLLSVSNDKDSKEVCMSGLCIAHQRYCDGIRGGNAIFFYPSEWAPSLFAWRNNDGVKPEYRGVIEVRLNNTIELIGIYSDRPLWSRGYLNSVSKWRPVALIEESKSRIETILCDSSLGFIPQKNVTFNADRLSIDGRDYHASSHNPKFTVKEEKPKTTTTVNIEGREYLILSRTPAVSPKEDKPMKPVYTAEMHAKGELPPVGADCILIIDSEPRQARVTYIGKSLGVCSNIDGGAEYAFLLGKASFKPIIKTIKVNGFDVPAPMSEAPEHGVEYFIASINSDYFVDDYRFHGDSYDKRWLSRGIAHSSKKSAIAHAKAMLGIDPNA